MKTVKLTLLSPKKHVFTHQNIYVQFFGLENYIINFNYRIDIKWVSIEKFRKITAAQSHFYIL